MFYKKTFSRIYTSTILGLQWFDKLSNLQTKTPLDLLNCIPQKNNSTFIICVKYSLYLKIKSDINKSIFTQQFVSLFLILLKTNYQQMMKTFTTILLLLLAAFSFGQNDTTRNQHFISISLTEIVCADLRLTYEVQFHKRHSLRIEGGYIAQIISYSPDANYLNCTSFADIANPYAFRGYNIALGYSFILNPKNEMKSSYVSARLTYTNKFCDNIVGVDGTDGIYYYSLFSAKETNYKINVMFGRKIRCHNKNSKINIPFYELYIGFGGNYIVGNSKYLASGSGREPDPTVFDIQHWNNYPKPSIETTNTLVPNICFGFKVGISWKKAK